MKQEQDLKKKSVEASPKVKKAKSVEKQDFIIVEGEKV